MRVHDEHPGFVRATATGRLVSVLAFLLLAAAVAIGTRAALTSTRTSDDPHVHAALSARGALELVGGEDGVLHFGERPRGVHLENAFTVRNLSQGESVRIDRISSSCSSAAAVQTPLTIPPAGEAQIPFRVALPVNHSEWTVALYLSVAGADAPQRVLLAFDSPLPFAEHADLTLGAPARLPLRELYRDRIARVACYPVSADEPVSAAMSDDGHALLIEPPPNVREVELLITVFDGSGGEERNSSAIFHSCG